MNFCLHQEKHEEKKLNIEWTLNQNMHYTEKLFREEQYTGTPWKYAFHGMRFGNALQL